MRLRVYVSEMFLPGCAYELPDLRQSAFFFARFPLHHELAHLYWQTLEWRYQATPALIARKIAGEVQSGRFELLGDRARLLKIYREFEARSATEFTRSLSNPRSHPKFGPANRGAEATLSSRAFGRVWVQVAVALAEACIDDYWTFFDCFQGALREALRREALIGEHSLMRFDRLPSTCAWVHLFSLHTGLSPPAASDFEAPIGRRIRNIGTGGRDGLVRRQEAERDIRARYRSRRIIGGWLRCSPQARHPDGNAQSQIALARRTAILVPGRSFRRASDAKLGDQLRLDRGRGSIPDAA